MCRNCLVTNQRYVYQRSRKNRFRTLVATLTQDNCLVTLTGGRATEQNQAMTAILTCLKDSVREKDRHTIDNLLAQVRYYFRLACALVDNILIRSRLQMISWTPLRR